MLNKKSVTSHNIGTAIFCLLAAFLFSSCSSMPSTDKNAPIASEQKETAQSSAAKKAWILASQENYDQAQNALNQLDRQHTLYPSETADIESLQDSAYFAWATALIIESDIDTAEDKSHINSQGLRLLNIIDIQANIDTLPIAEQIAFWDYKAKLYSKYSLIKYAIKSRIYVEHLQLSNNNPGNESFLHNHTQLWHLLHTLDAQDIQTLQHNSKPNTSLQAWLNLTKITLHSELNLDNQISAIDNWQFNNSTHPAALIPPQDIALIRNALRARPTHIAIILPMHGKYKAVGKAIRDGILSNFYNSSYKPSLSFYSASDTDDFLSIYQAAVEDGANWIIGPLLKAQLESLYTLDELPVPTLALNKLQIDRTAPKGLIEYSLSSTDEINSLIPLMEHQNTNRVITLAQKSRWAEDASVYFAEQWQASGHEQLGTFFFANSRAQSKAVQQALQIDLSKKRIQKVKWLLGGDIESHERRRQDIDGILILSKPQQAASLRPLLAFHYASNLGMYATSNIYRGYSLKSIDNDLRGIQFTDTPITIKSAQQPIQYYNKSPFIRMYGLGLDVFSITERFSLLSQLNDSKFYGATGIIGVQKNSLSRITNYAYFKSGKVFPLTISSNGDEAQ